MTADCTFDTKYAITPPPEGGSPSPFVTFTQLQKLTSDIMTRDERERKATLLQKYISFNCFQVKYFHWDKFVLRV